VAVAFLLLVGFLVSRGSGVVSGEGLDEGRLRVREAEETVSSAFLAVLDAERAGANVSALLYRLNSAAGQLSQAEMMLSKGDSGEAVDVAARSVAIAEDVGGEALNLRASAVANREFVFNISLAGSSVGIVVFFFLMFFVWRQFRARYVRRILDMRPVVVEDAEA